VVGLAVGAVLLLTFAPRWAGATSEAEYQKTCDKLKPVDVVSGQQLRQARRAYPGKPLQLSGAVQGSSKVGDKVTIILGLVDGATEWVDCEGDHPEIHAKARVRCIVEPTDESYNARLRLVDITYDSTPWELLTRAAKTALKIPPTDPEEIARSAAELQRRAPMPTRGADPTLTIKRAITHLNPRLSGNEVSVIAESIVKYSAQYNVDPYLVVAVIAAESRFNPKARSYKGAMGLGQLMPATAAAHKVDAWDPIANLHVAIRIIRRNLDKYGQNEWNKALAAYNAGVGAVDRYGGVPPYRETRNYLWVIYEYWCWLNGITPEPRPR
jgi:hypothetical protein